MDTEKDPKKSDPDATPLNEPDPPPPPPDDDDSDGDVNNPGKGG